MNEKKNEIETKEKYAKTAMLAQSIFSIASEIEASNHGYIQLKQIQNYGLRVITIEDNNTKLAECYKGTLLAPCFNDNNELVNLERIYFDKKVGKYQKRPLVGGQRNGAYYLIGEHTIEHNVILLAEGIATGFTVYEATGYPVAITYDCHNLLNVATILRKKYPHIKLLIISDDDRWHSKVNLRDAGVKAAKKVCANIEAVSYVLPDFEVLDLSEKRLSEFKPTDMNDLFVHLVSGGVDEADALAIIREQILTAAFKSEIMPHSAILNQLLEKVTEVNFGQLAELKEGEKLKNSQYQVIIIDQILTLAKNNHWGLCKQHDFLYLFNGEYWSLIEEDELKTFLGDAAKKMGLRNVHAQHFNFKDQLCKQFMTAANLPKPEQQKEIININLKNGTFEVTHKVTN